VSAVEQFGRNLFMARRRLGLTQEQLANSAGLHRSEIGLLERGYREPRLTTILKLLEALGSEPGDLFHRLHMGTKSAIT
jgi:transcriptional regulator with XRE-family HTH domain